MANLAHQPHLQAQRCIRHCQLQTHYSRRTTHQALHRIPQPQTHHAHWRAASASTQIRRLLSSPQHSSPSLCATVIDKQLHAGQPLYLCFVDLKAAYDKVQWPLIWQVLEHLGIHGKMLATIQSVYRDTSVAMGIRGHFGSIHSPSVGLRQGCPLSATLFGLFFLDSITIFKFLYQMQA